MEDTKTGLGVVGILVVMFAAFVFFIGMFASGWTTVRTGQVGVMVRLGAVTGKVLEPGFHLKTPFITSVKKINIQTNKEQADANAASKDLQTVNATIALNYSIKTDSVIQLFSQIGTDYKARIIDPFIQEAVKAVTAKYTAEELITKREEVGESIKSHLTEKLEPVGIVVQGISIVNFNFSHSFNEAIEAKVTAEQNALAAKNKLQQVQFEAEQAVAEAQGKAKALTIESAAINSNPQILQLRAIEKWNGQLPQVTSGGTPFINIK